MTAENVQIPFNNDDDADFWSHPVCKKYEANRLGLVRNIETKNHVGFNNMRGYLKFSCSGSCCKGEKEKKNHYLHRFLFECFMGLTEDGKVIDHIDNDKSNNKLENLQKINQSENCKKNNSGRYKKPQKIMAINVNTGEFFIYKSQGGAASDLGLQQSSVSSVLRNITKTALSKKYNESFAFVKINDLFSSPIIIIKNKKNINIKYVRRLNLKNN